MDNHYVIALVYDWLSQNPAYYSQWVNPYTQIRFSKAEKKSIACKIGGHWRREPLYGGLPRALRCVCQFETLSKPVYLGTPVRPCIERWTEDGTLIPRKYRVLVWA